MNKNFSGFFPIWDVLFGTYYMPRDRLPTDFGIHESVPQSFLGQLAYPFRRPSGIRSKNGPHENF